MTFSDKAAERGEPGYVWRSGQERRLQMILRWARDTGVALDNGCGLGTYLAALSPHSSLRFGIEIEMERARAAVSSSDGIAAAMGEYLPFRGDVFDLVLSNEVLEHVADDRRYLAEMARVCRAGGTIVLFCPNRWYPVEQHGVYWRGRYHFGNIPLINYLPNILRNWLAPHVRTYTRGGLLALTKDLPVEVVHHRRIFGGYDNIVTRLPRIGGWLRRFLYFAERTPFQVLGLSHLLVLKKR